MAARTGLQLLPQYRDISIELVEKRRQHWYRVSGYDELLPSVTTCLKAIDKSGPLVGWAKKETLKRVRAELLNIAYCGEDLARMVAGLGHDPYPAQWVDEFIEKARARPEEDASAKGRAAHGLIAELLEGGDPEVPDELAPAVRGALEMVSDYGLAVEAVECPVWHPRYEYAGTVDLIARDTDGRLVVVDWKRSKGLYDEHAYQVSAYTRAVEVLTGEDVASAYVVRLARSRDEEVRYECRQAFVSACYPRYLAAQALWLGLNTKEEVWLR